VDDRERALIAASGAWVAVSTESNQNNAVGAFRPDGLDPDRLLLGTDGMHGDMLRALQAAFLSGREHGGLTPAQAWRALDNNRRYLEAHHPSAARPDDLVILAYAPPTPLDEGNIAGHALFGLDARHVRTVIAGGRVVLDDGRLTTIDEDDTLRFCREQARRLWDRLRDDSGAPGHDGARP
jgi:cytosine/adenosine deaminase-related metal-dependent hydrolase